MFFFYFTLLIGFYYGEDSLGGARADFLYHFNFSLTFLENFSETFERFGLETRNSPIFWILLSYINKFFSYDFLRFINTSVSILIAIVFFQCLKLKFNNIKDYSLIMLTSILFLSPTVRSLSIWPYPLIWGLLFFLISIYFFLKFEISKKSEKKFQLIFLSIIFVAISAYLYPSFAVFFIYYFYKAVNYFNISRKILTLSFLSIIMALPAIFYLHSIEILKTFQLTQGTITSNTQGLNLSNKILIISTMIIFFLTPIFNFKILIKNVFSLKRMEILIIFLFCLVNFYFFNFPTFDSGLGGGFFYKVSHIVFGNNIIFFLVSIISILIIYSSFKNYFQNYLIFILLILFTPQLTLYQKYYDPLIFFIFVLLINFDFEEHYIRKKSKYIQLYFFSTCFLLMGIFKSLIY